MRRISRQITFVLLTIFFFTIQSYGQVSPKEWWNGLSPAWKKIFQKQELKGKDVEPNDEQLDRIVKVTHIDCSHNEEITDLKPLARLNLLEVIRCNDTKIKSLEGIESLSNLKELDCSNNDNINSLLPLRNIVSLEKINCGNTMVKDLSPLKNLINLKILDVHFATVNKLMFIGDLKSLEKLDVSRNESLFDIQGVERLVNLIDFNISQTQVEDLTPLKDSKKLEVLNISSTPVATLRPLQQIKTLREIDCSETMINAASLDYLYAHVYLGMLRARNIDATQAQIDAFTTMFTKKNATCTILITPKN